MSLKFIGRKKGMTQFFDKSGARIVCTVISAEPNVVTQIKNTEKDGYSSIQLGAFKLNDKQNKKLNKPQLGSYKKSGASPCRHLLESKVNNTDEYQVGSEVGVGYFTSISLVDVCGTSKGKGFQGVMKLHGFRGGPAAHGSGFHRSAGSTGMRSTPGRSFPGGKRASRMGGEKKTVQNLRVVHVDEAKNLLLVSGAVPGCRDGIVYISKAIKNHKG